MIQTELAQLTQQISSYHNFQALGKLRGARGLLTARLPAAVGDLCRIEVDRDRSVLAETIGFDHGLAQIMPFHHVDGLELDTEVICMRRKMRVPVGDQLLGRVINGLGEPLDGRDPLRTGQSREIQSQAPAPMNRPRIRTPFITGQRVIDGLLTCGVGQRVALMAGSGVGKSTLLGEMARGASCDMAVIAMIGERGREVRPFLEDCLGANGLARSVVVVSTSDQTPLMRVRAAQAAVTIADHFRSRGANVLFLLDSLTRMAMAQREIGLLLGEPPSSRGYTPSVFLLMSHLLECLGVTEDGSITGILTVLVEGDDVDDPIADAVRAIVDGHFVLDRRLSEKGHYPAVDVARSLSRLFRDVTEPDHQQAAQKIRSILATHAEVADLIRVGAYVQGSSAQVDRALSLIPAVQKFLRQEVGTHCPYDETRQVVSRIAAAWQD